MRHRISAATGPHEVSVSNSSNKYDVIVAGGGPAGASAAIHLAKANLKVLLIEQKTFPRAKLCGEFISPECIAHFEKLGVALDMISSQPAQILETVFYSRRGREIVVPSRWFGGNALGLSRAVMDHHLLERAKALGVNVLENSTVSNLVEDRRGVTGVIVKAAGDREYRASVVVDATGRSRVLARKTNSTQPVKPSLVAFKAHLTGTRGTMTACEIYSYPGGYGGLSTIENGRSNLCFIIQASHVRRAHSDPQTVIRENLMLNRRAAFTLECATVETDWLSVALESFGRRQPSPKPGLLAIGDSAAFIDPFTGSGMLMALESGQLVAEQIVQHLAKLDERNGIANLCESYTRAYLSTFDSRLRVCSLLRRVAFRPLLAQLAISAFSCSDRFRGWLARSTHSSSRERASQEFQI
jgi:flavin-dependent dehydrogenase